MEPLHYRLFVCNRGRPDGDSCAGKGAEALLSALKLEIARQGLNGEVKALYCGCLDLCSQGPNLIVYPSGQWYSGLGLEQVPDFVATQLMRGEVFEPCAWDAGQLQQSFVPIIEKKKGSAKQ